VKDLTKKRFDDTNRDAIMYYYQAGGASNEEGIILTDKQKELSDRWLFAAAKIREMKYSSDQVAKFIMGAFDVGRDTAYRDIVNAQYVFAASYPINKNFLIQCRIEFLIKKINDAYVDNDLNGSIKATKLEKELRGYIEMYKEVSPARSPKTINFIIQNNLLITTQTGEQAFQQADEVIKQLEENDDY
jgi:hypothetical protein